MEDSNLMHCMEMGRLHSDQHYRKDALSTSGQYQLPLDMVNLVQAKKAQALASDQDYKTHIHSYTVLPDDIKVQWAKKAYDLQSQVRMSKANKDFGVLDSYHKRVTGQSISIQSFKFHLLCLFQRMYTNQI